MSIGRSFGALTVGLLLAVHPAAHAWDYPGHRMVNQLALASLPEDFPRFVHHPANAERIAFLAGEPDRWRNVPDLPLKHSGGSWADHFFDVEDLANAGMDVRTVTSFRYDFMVQFAAARAAHVHKFERVDPAKDVDRTAEWPGFAPWAITEAFGRLRSAFSYLRVLEDVGSPDDVANAQANVIYLMGVMGHYVGDCAQPLHTTRKHNGWVGANPQGYTTWDGFHAWVDGKDGGIFTRGGLTLAPLLPRAQPARVISLQPRPDARDPMFVAVLDYVLAQFERVEPLYQLEKDGKLGNRGAPLAPEGRAFIEQQLLAGGQMLGSIWLTAFRGAVPDTNLRAAVIRRAAEAARSGGAAPAPAGTPRTP